MPTNLKAVQVTMFDQRTLKEVTVECDSLRIKGRSLDLSQVFFQRPDQSMRVAIETQSSGQNLEIGHYSGNSIYLRKPADPGSEEAEETLEANANRDPLKNPKRGDHVEGTHSEGTVGRAVIHVTETHVKLIERVNGGKTRTRTVKKVSWVEWCRNRNARVILDS